MAAPSVSLRDLADVVSLPTHHLKHVFVSHCENGIEVLESDAHLSVVVFGPHTYDRSLSSTTCHRSSLSPVCGEVGWLLCCQH